MTRTKIYRDNNTTAAGQIYRGSEEGRLLSLKYSKFGQICNFLPSRVHVASIKMKYGIEELILVPNFPLVGEVVWAYCRICNNQHCIQYSFIKEILQEFIKISNATTSKLISVSSSIYVLLNIAACVLLSRITCMPAQHPYWQSHFHTPIVINKHESRESHNIIHVTR